MSSTAHPMATLRASVQPPSTRLMLALFIQYLLGLSGQFLPEGDGAAWASAQEADVHVPLCRVVQLRLSVWLLLIAPLPRSVHFGEHCATPRGFGEMSLEGARAEPRSCTSLAAVQEAALGWLQWGKHGRVLKVPSGALLLSSLRGRKDSSPPR